MVEFFDMICDFVVVRRARQHGDTLYNNLLLCCKSRGRMLARKPGIELGVDGMYETRIAMTE